MLHDLDSVTAELERVRRHPPAGSAPPVLASFGVDVADGSAEEYTERVRAVLSAALRLACAADFDEEDLPAGVFPEWFRSVCAADRAAEQEFARNGRIAYTRRGGGEPWSLRNWIHRFDPDEESRGWEFWDAEPVGASRVRVRVDSWGESFFGSLELLWLLYTAGAAHVEGPLVTSGRAAPAPPSRAAGE
ncbi:hypothetical protein ACWC10_01150 [Streptomyces sp. NPDC001595]|uniref:hypothetical protein n=1 Tax=Streptomyces sp. NPDC001532 TaxID=3154520 RepID=UPI0033197621